MLCIEVQWLTLTKGLMVLQVIRKQSTKYSGLTKSTKDIEIPLLKIYHFCYLAKPKLTIAVLTSFCSLHHLKYQTD